MEPLRFESTRALDVAILFLVVRNFLLFVAVVRQGDGGSDAIRESLVSANVHTQNTLLGSFPSWVTTDRVVTSPKRMMMMILLLLLLLPMNYPMEEEGTVKNLVRGGRQLLR